MEWMKVICMMLLVVIVVLVIKILLLKKAAREISREFQEKLGGDTNTLITVSTGDKTMRLLAVKINEELVKLRQQKHRYARGDAELKNAVTNISHDLRTPLTAIRSYLELLEEAEMSGAAAGYVEIIKNRTEQLALLTEELFRYSVISSPDYDAPPEETDIRSVLEESLLGFYASLGQRGIVPDISLPEEKVIRSINPAALSRVFSNILGNAVKYSDGDLDIAMSRDGEISFSNHSAALSGVEVEKLFDRFFTLESARKSTGLGLSIARLLVEQMNGEISAEYAEGKLCIRLKL